MGLAWIDLQQEWLKQIQRAGTNLCTPAESLVVFAFLCSIPEPTYHTLLSICFWVSKHPLPVACSISEVPSVLVKGTAQLSSGSQAPYHCSTLKLSKLVQVWLNNYSRNRSKLKSLAAKPKMLREDNDRYGMAQPTHGRSELQKRRQERKSHIREYSYTCCWLHPHFPWLLLGWLMSFPTRPERPCWVLAKPPAQRNIM